MPTPTPRLYKFLGLPSHGETDTLLAIALAPSREDAAERLADFGTRHGYDGRRVWSDRMRVTEFDVEHDCAVVTWGQDLVAHFDGRLAVRAPSRLWRFAIPQGKLTRHPTIDGLTVGSFFSFVLAAGPKAAREALLAHAQEQGLPMAYAEAVGPPVPLASDPGVLVWAETTA